MRIQIVLAGLLLGIMGVHVALALAGPPDPKTMRAWRAKCASCHGEDGSGQTDQGKKMGIANITGAVWQKEFTDEKIKAAINNGVKREKNGKHQEMDPFQGSLRPDQVDALVGLIRTLAK